MEAEFSLIDVFSDRPFGGSQLAVFPRAEGLSDEVMQQLVRAENLIHGSDQQGCSSDRLAVMITDHVPAVRLPPDHPSRRVAAAVPA